MASLAPQYAPSENLPVFILRTDITNASVSGTSNNCFVNAVGNPLYAFPFDTDFKVMKNVGLTTMPIPTSDEPLILNFGGETISVTVAFKTNNPVDVQFLYQYFNSANPSAVYQVHMEYLWGSYFGTYDSSTGVGTSVFTGVVQNFSVHQASGVIMWDINITLDIGEVV